MKSPKKLLIGQLCLGLGLLFGQWSAQAEDVFVTTSLGTVAANNTPCPPTCFTGSVSSTGSSAFSTASPQPPVTSRRSKFGFANGCSWSVQPGDYSSTGSAQGTAPLQSPGLYRIYVSKGAITSCTTDLKVTMTTDTGSLLDANSNAAPSGVTGITAFQVSGGANTWVPVGYITNTTPNPIITFSFESSAIGLASGVRWYMDEVRFENLGDPCANVSAQVNPTGPLVAGQTTVDVVGVTAGATNVTVYANGASVGSAGNAAGFAAGTVTVTTSALQLNDQIKATQTLKNRFGDACTSALGSAAFVGSTGNPIKVMLSCWKNTAYTGPVGATGVTGTGFPYFMAANAFVGGFNTAPIPGRKVVPGTCWQTVTFQNRTGGDDAIDQNTGAHVINNDAFCALEGLVFSMDSGNSGPYDIYVDSIMNGTNVIENFEGYLNGTPDVTLVGANKAPAPSPSSYLSAPNTTAISQNYAFDGTNSCRIQWQWIDSSTTRWAHILANATTGKHYPQLDTTKPITMRILVLPAGETTAHAFSGTVSSITNSVPYFDTTNVLGVTVTGAGPYTYLWTVNGNTAPGITTDRTFVIDGNGTGTGLNSDSDGNYTVTVSDGTCTETRSILVTATLPSPTIITQPQHAVVTLGSTVTVMTAVGDGHTSAGNPLSYQWQKNGNNVADQTTTALSFPLGAALSDAGNYTLIAANGYGSATSVVASVDVVASGVFAGNGTGLRGDYRTLHNSTNAFGDAPTLSRTDATVNFDFGAGSPDPSISADVFTARWTGQVQALGTDTYTFSTITDDGVRLWVNGQLLVDNWTLHGATTNSGTIALTGTNQYSVVMEYFENAVSATAKFYWASASGSIPFEAVPQSQLYPGAAITVLPKLSAAVSSGTNVVFSWSTGSYNLAWSTNVAGPYTNYIYGVTSPYTNVSGAEKQKFFLLKQ